VRGEAGPTPQASVGTRGALAYLREVYGVAVRADEVHAGDAALRAGDLKRCLTHCLAAVGARPRAVATTLGPGYLATTSDRLVCVALDRANGRVTIEAPVARLAPQRRVPALRAALELEPGGRTRMLLRGDLLLARRVEPVVGASASSLALAIASLGAHARELGALFQAHFDASPVAADDDGGIESLGAPARPADFGLHPSGALSAEQEPVTLMDAPITTRMDPSRASVTSESRESRLDDDEMPAILAPPASSRGSIPDDMPAVLSPLFGAPVGAAPELGRTATWASRVQPTPVRGTPTAATSPSAPSPLAAPATSLGRARAPTLPIGVPVDAFTTPGSGSIPGVEATPPATAGSASVERLLELLRQARSLAAEVLPPTLEPRRERDTLLQLLMRATAFHAVHDFADELPGPVSHLYRVVVLSTRDSSLRMVSGAEEGAEPPLAAIDRILAARGAGFPVEKVAIKGLKSAAEARELLQRYVALVERAPSDVSLRHFMMLGALVELLERTKLPEQTAARLRDIVKYARRDSTKTASLELMKTAMARIITG
jgi:hypothetical protein